MADVIISLGSLIETSYPAHVFAITERRKKFLKINLGTSLSLTGVTYWPFVYIHTIEPTMVLKFVN